MLTDEQIKDLATRMSIPLEGVYFKDELPKKLVTNKTYILNLQDSEDDDGNQNDGTHWTMLQINETPNGQINPFYFDPYGVEPPEIVKLRVRNAFKKYLPYSHKDIQSLMNNACGFYCLALAHFVNAYKGRSNNFYHDCENFLDMFDDLNKSIDWKKNEYILKHFFLGEDEKNRIDLKDPHILDTIVDEDEKGNPDLMKLPVDIKMMDGK